MHDSRSPPEPTLIPSRGFLTPPGGQLVQTLVGHSQSAVYGLAASSDGKYAVTGYADFLQYILFLGKPYASANGRNVVGQQLPTSLDVTCCVRFHTLSHISACCWDVVAESLKTVKLLARCKRRQHC